MYAYIGETLPLLEFRKSLWLQGILRFQLEPLAQEKGACCRSSRGFKAFLKEFPTGFCFQNPSIWVFFLESRMIVSHVGWIFVKNSIRMADSNGFRQDLPVVIHGLELKWLDQGRTCW